MTPREADRDRLTIGLTGGIASGKSVVADIFGELGVTVIDADVVAREVVKPGEPALEQIVAELGADVLDRQGELDRRRLRQRVFGQPSQRARLEQILHPLIRRRMHEHLQAASGPYCVLCIPLLVETGGLESIHRVLVVDASEDEQIERAMRRDCSSRETIERILAAQATRSERLSHADDVIYNDGDLARLRGQVEALHERYLGLAGNLPVKHKWARIPP